MSPVFSGWLWHPAFWLFLAAYFLAYLLRIVHRRKQCERRERLWQEQRSHRAPLERKTTTGHRRIGQERQATEKQNFTEWICDYIEKHPELFQRQR